MLITDKVALVTGAARGIGKEYAEAILQNGAKGVVIVDILDDIGQQTVEELNAKYGESSAIYVHADVCKNEELKGAFHAAISKYGGLDIVINNAGIMGDEETEAAKRNLIDVNLFGVIRGTELAIEQMRTDKGGKGGVIINISSIMATQTLGFARTYTASKHAVLGYTRSCGVEFGDALGIKFRVICPGSVATDMAQSFVALIEKKDEWALTALEKVGGFTQISQLAAACIQLIEQDGLPQDTVALCEGTGNWLIYPDQFIKKPFE